MRPATIGMVKKDEKWQDNRTPTWLYETLRALIDQQKQSQRGMASIVRGEAPDGSGNPLIDTANFFFKPGLPGDQIGFGGTRAGGTLTFSSTKNATKGFIYLGLSAPRFAYDETNVFLGLGTDAPAVKLHINTPSAGTTTTGQTGTVMIRGAYGGTTLFDLVPLQFSPGVYDIALKPTNAGFQVISTDGTAGLRLVPTTSRAFIQTGIKDSGGVVTNMNMTLGGLGASYATHLGIAFGQVFFDNNATNPQVGFGVGANPSTFSVGVWKGIIAGKGISTTEPVITLAPVDTATNLAAIFDVRSSLFGNRLITMEYDTAAGNSRLTFWANGGANPRSGYFLNAATEFGGTAGKISVVDRNANRAMSWDSGTLWNDSKVTTLIDLGASISAHNGAVFAGIDAGVLARFAIMSSACLVTNVLTGGTVAPPTALWQIRPGSGTGNVLLAMQRISGQTADLTDWWDTDGSTKLARVNSEGDINAAGLSNALVDEDGFVVTDGTEILFSAVT